jgi:hypothetical protein
LPKKGGVMDEFQDALDKLGIGDYRARIWHSNSRGELLHLQDYFVLAENLPEPYLKAFRPWFESVVKEAEAKWKRPESIFQYILELYKGALKGNGKGWCEYGCPSPKEILDDCPIHGKGE